jgi:hypothetical protein
MRSSTLRGLPSVTVAVRGSALIRPLRGVNLAPVFVPPRLFVAVRIRRVQRFAIVMGLR